MRHVGARLVVAMFVLCGTAEIARADYPVHATGCFVCQAGAGNEWPMAGVKVRLMDSDCDGSRICDDQIADGRTNAKGCYDLYGEGGDGGDYSWSKPDPYVLVTFQADAGEHGTVNLMDPGRALYSGAVDEHAHDNRDGDIDFGTWAFGTSTAAGEPNPCSIMLAAAREYGAHEPFIDQARMPGQVDILYQKSSGALTYVDYTDIWWGPVRDWTIIQHEMIHLLFNYIAGDSRHFIDDASHYRYARVPVHNRCNSHHADTENHEVRAGFAFYEGLAEAWAGVDCDVAGTDFTDLTIEGNVAAAITMLTSCPAAEPGEGVCANHWARGQRCDGDDDCAAHGEGGRCMPNPQLMWQILTDVHVHSFANFEGEWVSRTGCPNATDRIVPPPETSSDAEPGGGGGRRSWREDSVRRLTTLKEAIEAADVVAEQHGQCSTGDCFDSFQARIRPELLRGELAIAQLQFDFFVDDLGGEVDLDSLNEVDLRGHLDRMREQATRLRVESAELRKQALEQAVKSASVLQSNAADALLAELKDDMDRGGEDLSEPLVELDEPAESRVANTRSVKRRWTCGCDSSNDVGSTALSALLVLLAIRSRRRRPSANARLRHRARAR